MAETQRGVGDASPEHVTAEPQPKVPLTCAAHAATEHLRFLILMKDMEALHSHPDLHDSSL